MSHLYRVAIEELSNEQGSATEQATFEVENHDDIFLLIEKIREKKVVSEDELLAFIVGLKLFTGTLVQNRKHPLFAPLYPHVLSFIKSLKAHQAA